MAIFQRLAIQRLATQRLAKQRLTKRGAGMLRIHLAAGVAGAALVQVLAELPGQPAAVGLYATVALACLAAWLARRPVQAGGAAAFRGILLHAAGAVLCLALGAAYAAWRAEPRLADALAHEHENLVTRLVLQVDGLATRTDGGQRFEARVLHSPVAGVPSRLMVSWPDAGPAPATALRTGDQPASPGTPGSRLVMPGQVFSAAMVLRRPHGAWNPHGFDFEAWMFERGLRASATVRGVPRLVDDRPAADFSILVQRIRHVLRAAAEPALEGTRYGPVMLALAIGDQAGVRKDDWAVFNRVGITHLVSISGSHVTMLAALAAACALWSWKRIRWQGMPLAERMPAQVVAAGCALVVAWLYCLLAGWGVPAQRTFFMLATVAGSAMLRLPLSASRVLIAAAVLVTMFDPWAPLASGFWLSFGAVAILMLADAGRWRLPTGRKWVRALSAAARLQMAITLALVPLLAIQFHEISLASPLANAVAIPVVSLLVTPLALAGVLLAPVPVLGMPGAWLAQLGEWIFRWMMVPVAWLAQAEWSTLSVAAPPWPLVVLGCAGVWYSLQPRGVPGRLPALLLLLPIGLYQPGRPPYGGWKLTALDVGQGGAVVLQTRNHVVVFDTGPPFGREADAGERVVWPYLRAAGARRVDELVVSHGDADHAGGLRSVLGQVAVSRMRASYAVPDDAAQRPAVAPCRAGQGWAVDGVVFAFLHPQAALPESENPRDTNANSCVLHVQGLYHSALLTGDIGVAEERALVARHGRGLQADVVMMAHHGSKTSSAAEFVEGTGASHAFAQAGYLSRFGHPVPEVVARWQAGGATVHRSDRHGAVTFISEAGGMQVERLRETRGRYWHGR